MAWSGRSKKEFHMGRVTVRRPVVKVTPSGRRRRPDALAAEEPLEIRVDGKALAVTMRTPGHDVELVHGFLLTEGVVGDREDVSTARYCDSVDESGKNTYNVLDVALAPGVPEPDTGVERNFYTTSSCGVCGKAALDAVKLKTRYSPANDPAEVSPTVLTALPDALREAQRVFESTGGLHAAGLFRTDGTMLVVREDIGRHNAVDKVVGALVLAGRVPGAEAALLVVSGRASYEVVQKASAARVPVIASVSAASSLAVDLARASGITLCGFVRNGKMTVYAHPERVR
jgi:FdhD protein